MKTLAVIVAVLIGITGLYVANKVQTAGVGSVLEGGESQATSTAANAVYGAFTGDQLLKTGRGTLSAVIITGANTGVLNFYNATTSNVLLRTGNIASSTILLASFPASTVAGEYMLDAVFTTGLLLELETGLMPTTTIMYR